MDRAIPVAESATSPGRCTHVVSLALDRLTIYLNPPHVRESSEAMSTSRSEIYKTDLVNFAQIRLLEENAFGLHLFNIQLDPPDVGQIKLAFVEIESVPIGVVSNEPSSVSELDNRTDFVKPGCLRVPSNSRFAGQVGEALLMPERDSASRGAEAGPYVRNTALIVHRRVILADPVDLEIEIGVRYDGLRHRDCGRVLPAFPEKKGNWLWGAARRRRFLSESTLRHGKK